MTDKTTPVLIRAELLDGLDEDGNARVLIGYAEGTCAQHSRVRFVDPALILPPLAVYPGGERFRSKKTT